MMNAVHVMLRCVRCYECCWCRIFDDVTPLMTLLWCGTQGRRRSTNADLLDRLERHTSLPRWHCVNGTQLRAIVRRVHRR